MREAVCCAQMINLGLYDIMSLRFEKNHRDKICLFSYDFIIVRWMAANIYIASNKKILTICFLATINICITYNGRVYWVFDNEAHFA